MAQLYAHTAHYIGHLLHNHPARRPSVAGASDPHAASADPTHRPPAEGANGSTPTGLSPSRLSREQLVEQLVDLIVMEEEDAAKDLMGVELGLQPGDTALDQYILSLMHKVRDDMNQVPFSPTSLPTPKRPTSRPSSSTLSKSSLTFRPLTPLASHSQPMSPSTSGQHSSPSPTAAALSGSPSRAALSPADPPSRSSFSHPSGSSPSTTTSATLIPPPSSSSSSGASPILSPKTLSARAVEFRPSPRAAHATIVGGSFVGSPGSPVDWSIGSSLGAATVPSLIRSSSNLALFSDPTKPLAAHHAAAARIDDEDEDDDDFSPFGSLPAGSSPSLHHRPPQHLSSLGGGAGDDPAAAWASSSASAGSYSSGGHSFPQQMTMGEMDELFSPDNLGGGADDYLPGGMTPMDLLSSIFTGLSTHEVEVALHKHGYDFDSTMQYLSTSSAVGTDGAAVRPATMTTSTSSAVQIVAPTPSAAAKPFVPREGYVVAGGRNGAVIRPPSPTQYSTKSPYGGRVCRYYLNGECRRADCRFSHDIERALCRFWLRGQCAKGEQCEFIHTLPPTFDPDTLSPAVGALDFSPSESSTPTTPLPEDDDFPVLGGGGGAAKSSSKGLVAKVDSSRTRFSSAVKKAPVSTPMATRASESSSSSSAAAPPPVRSTFPTSSTLSAVLPRPSSRLPLRPPTLLPTLPTGAALNSMYMSARAKAIDLGTQRNAYLAKAAEAWKRGDGAAAKRFSKEGQDLNDLMNGENNAAAEKLVRDRLKIVQDAARAREGRTTDPRDRTRKGVLCGGALGVVLGVASSGGSTSAEREEALCDVHLLHGSEAVIVLEQWLLALEAERYLGLAYVIVGEEKHTGTQDAGRGASKVRLSQSVKAWLAQWHYPWSEAGGVLCIDPLEHLNDP